MTILRGMPGHRTAAAGVALAVSLAVVFGTAVSAASLTPWNTNLVKNPGFEAGAASSDGFAVVPIPNWSAAAGSPNQGVVVKYGQPGWPTTSEGTRIKGGHNFWASGNFASGKCPSAFQRIEIKGRNALIDSGSVFVIVTAQLATYLQQYEQPEVRVTFRSSSPQLFDLGHISLLAFKTGSVFVKQTKNEFVPAGTRYLDVELRAVVHESTYCDSYVDKVVVKIKHS